MIFNNIEFHNVEELQPSDKGYIMRRLPKSIREKMNDGVKNSTFSTGVELRFKIKGEGANIILRCKEAEEAQVAYIYYGSFQGGWKYSSKMIYTHETKIHIQHPENLDVLQQITKEKNLLFSPEVVRILLPYVNCYFVGVEGEVEPPSPEDIPNNLYLAYGSSITHGSLALASPYTYPARIAGKLNCDYINLGFAGSAQMEPAMAEYIVSRKDWTFASVEMGINMVGDAMPIQLFEERVDGFTAILAQDKRPVFATSIFGYNGHNQEKAKAMREIVRKYAGERLLFTDGLTLLNNPTYISQDLTHPALDGIEEITNNWCKIMKEKLFPHL